MTWGMATGDLPALTLRWSIRSCMLICGVVISTLQPCYSQGESESPSWSIKSDLSAQVIFEGARLGPAGSVDRTEYNAVELRPDFVIRCKTDLCDGASAVLKPRLWLGTDRHPAWMPHRRPDPLPQAYVDYRKAGMTLTAGKRLMGWGPSLLFSPSNRLFPDNGSMTPRREISGKPLGSVTVPVNDALDVQLLVADPKLTEVPGMATGGAFAMGRVQYAATGRERRLAGLLYGGGGGLRPYLGAYAETGLSDAWTAGAEMSVGRGYGKVGSSQAAQFGESDSSWRLDSAMSLRYGLSNGAEVAMEYIYNGYALCREQLAMAGRAAMPAVGDSVAYNRPFHPLPLRHYLNLQTTWPKLFGDRRWNWTGRLVQGWAPASAIAFSEIGFSPEDHTTLHFGAYRAWGGGESTNIRPVTQVLYAAVELNF